MGDGGYIREKKTGKKTQMKEDDFRERIDRILDKTSAEDLKKIYYFLLGREGMVMEADGGRDEKYHE